MKIFILALLVHGIGSCSLMASNFVPHSKVLEGSNQAHQMKSSCEAISGENCYDIGSYPSSVYSEKVLKFDIETCADESDCQEKHELKTCETKIKNLDQMESYCTKKVIEIDDSKFLSYQAELTVQAQEKALEDAKSIARSMRDCGNGVLDLMFVRNAQKSLSTAQVKQFMANNASVQSFLSGGALESAKEEILATEADGVLVTEGDKVALVSEIDKCLLILN